MCRARPLGGGARVEGDEGTEWCGRGGSWDLDMRPVETSIGETGGLDSRRGLMLQRVSESLQRSLLEQPESGMGYQIAVVDHARYLILDAAIAVPVQAVELVRLLPEESGQSQQGHAFIDQWGRYPVGRLAKDAAEALNGMAEKWLTEKDPLSLTAGLPELGGTTSQMETHRSYLSMSRPGELFVRYSAFASDRRINPDGSVRSGTYVTTENDASHVPSGLSAVGRYALPNPAPARYRFVLSPPEGTRIRCGAAAPKFNQAGGGVEVLFSADLPAGTASGPQSIAER